MKFFTHNRRKIREGKQGPALKRSQGSCPEHSEGFTLIETLVAISIFTISVVAMMVTLAGGLQSTEYAKEKLVASYLAEEGVEYMHNLRDTYELNSSSASAGWAAFQSKLSSGSCTTGCYFDTSGMNYANDNMPITGTTVAACSSQSSSSVCPNHPILYNSSTAAYGYGSGSTTGYARRIQSKQISSDEIQIISIVSWTQGSGLYTITQSEDLFNWVD